MYQRSKADRFSTVQKDPLSVGADPLGDDTMTVDIMGMAHSDLYRKHDFCLISSDDSMSDLAIRLRKEGRRVTGVGRRQAPPSFLQHCDAFIYIDPANRYELLMDEGLVREMEREKERKRERERWLWKWRRNSGSRLFIVVIFGGFFLGGC